MPILKPGDIVDIIAPGSQKNPDRLDESFSFLRSWGLVPRCPEGIFGQDPFYSNATPQRSAFLQQSVEAKDSQVIWALRGGSGSTRLLKTLENCLPTKQKTLIGFSDVTALNLYAYQNWRWPCVHGPTLGQMAENLVDEKTIQAMKDLLFRGVVPTLNKLVPLNSFAEKMESRTAPLTGGNASLIQYSLGTPWQIQTKESFLFLEDVDEKPYRTLERLEHMRQAGIFKQVEGIFLFDFTFNNADENGDTNLYPKAFDLFAQEVSVPVFKGSGVGHFYTNLPVVLGAIMHFKDFSLTPIEKAFSSKISAR